MPWLSLYRLLTLINSSYNVEESIQRANEPPVKGAAQIVDGVAYPSLTLSAD